MADVPLGPDMRRLIEVFCEGLSDTKVTVNLPELLRRQQIDPCDQHL